MSTEFIAKRKIIMDQVFDGRMKKYNVQEHISENTTKLYRRLADGESYLWVIGDDDGSVSVFKNYGFNDPSHILESISKEFDTKILVFDPYIMMEAESIDDYEARISESAKESENTILQSVIEYLTAKANGLNPNQIYPEHLIAERLVADQPDLSLPENHERLISEILRTPAEEYKNAMMEIINSYSKHSRTAGK